MHDSWATAREAPIHRLATHRIAEGDATAAPTTGATVAGVANGTVVQVVQAGER